MDLKNSVILLASIKHKEILEYQGLELEKLSLVQFHGDFSPL